MGLVVWLGCGAGGLGVAWDNISIDFNAAQVDVPEPSRLAVLGLSLLALAAIRRKSTSNDRAMFEKQLSLNFWVTVMRYNALRLC